jgi:hypothetical protein
MLARTCHILATTHLDDDMYGSFGVMCLWVLFFLMAFGIIIILFKVLQRFSSKENARCVLIKMLCWPIVDDTVGRTIWLSKNPLFILLTRKNASSVVFFFVVPSRFVAILRPDLRFFYAWTKVHMKP